MWAVNHVRRWLALYVCPRLMGLLDNSVIPDLIPSYMLPCIRLDIEV
jgi:hypothetical protein